ncbi:MAG: undecaprenyl diphosphate synthase family protein [Candidatus Nanohaloarchaea archaeon]
MHLGVIPDGNRRYARKIGVSKRKAYRKATELIADIADEIDVEEATFYLLSEDNLERDEEELDTLFDLMEERIEELVQRFSDNDFSFNWATTRPEALPEHLRQKLRDLEEEYDSGEKRMNALISYSGKQDIVQAAQKVSGNGADFSRESIREHLEINSDIDFVVRTGDNPTREALSDFPIWNASYAEYYHLKKHFPAVTIEDVQEALDHYHQLRKKKGE